MKSDHTCLNLKTTHRIQTATPSLIHPTVLRHFSSLGCICQLIHVLQPMCSKMGHVKGIQVRCYWKEDPYMSVKFMQEAKKVLKNWKGEKKKKAVKNIERGIYLLNMSLPGSAVTGWWARFGGPQGWCAAHSLLRSTLGLHSGRSRFSVALLCQAGEKQGKELLKLTIPKSPHGPAAHPATINKQFSRSPTANICWGGEVPSPVAWQGPLYVSPDS